jgi:dihydrofolate synthase/folylpolyglutamate synthase
VIAEACRERAARLVDVPERVRVSPGRRPREVTFTAGAHRLEDVTLGLAGRHQVDNAAVAYCLFLELASAGVRLTADAMGAGLSRTRWPGRLERRSWRGAEVILDAAHNTAGARALAAYLGDEGWTDATLVLGVMRDKDVTGMLSELLPCCRRLVCTTAPSPRALEAGALAALASSVARALALDPPEILAVDEPARALDAACRPGGRVVAAGSIFLIGPLRGILR